MRRLGATGADDIGGGFDERLLHDPVAKVGEGRNAGVEEHLGAPVGEGGQEHPGTGGDGAEVAVGLAQLKAV
ncbi:MAG: hypothetical protein M3P37_07605 [Actinomycetota bacterium]|nr:hypothetical protein [Actinomycetota bacterium]